MHFHASFVLAATGLVAALVSGPAALGRQPNIVFILADDIGQTDLGCYGNTQIATPRFDRMAAEGTRFTQAFCGAPVCAPSRTVLNVGLHSGHAPVRGNRGSVPLAGQHPLPADTVTVAELLKKAGYATGAMGKWGMGMFDTTGSPLKQGYDRFFGYNCQWHAHTYFPDYLYDDDRRMPLAGNEGDGIGKTYAQDLIQKAALDFVRQNSQRPFFLYYAVTLPHGKHEIDDLGAYRDRPWGAQQKAFAAQVSRLDSDVGQLLDLLAELGIDDNTIVFFAGDNGLIPTGEPLRPKAEPQLRGGKGTMYEGGLRQPALVRWPGTVPAGRVSDEPWAFWDFLPTAVELAGATLPAGFETDGLSLVSFLKGGKAPEREFFYWELHVGERRPTPLSAVRFGPWKALRESPAMPLELYNIADDVGETRDLAAAHPDLVAKAEALMKQAHRDDPAWPVRFGKKPAAAAAR
jgi:arylsulfatase A-like enzyme